MWISQTPRIPPLLILFTAHIIPYFDRPDIVWWITELKSINLVELTISFETSFDAAQERYNYLLESAFEVEYALT